jgi:hypothetical protein
MGSYNKLREIIYLLVLVDEIAGAWFGPQPNAAKAGGLQSPGVKGEIVVGYLDPLTTQDLRSSGFPAG